MRPWAHGAAYGLLAAVSALPEPAGMEAGPGRVGRRGIWITLAVIVVIAAFLALRISQAIGTKQANSSAAKSASPTVTVVPVGLSELPTTVNIIGTIAARYDVPIGIEGDGGRVALIAVEAGDRVKRGQLLARLDMSVLKPQVRSLAAALDQARAESELAAAEYQRALKVGSAGALSTEETERRHSAAVTAAAKVKVAAAQLAEAQARLARTDVRAPTDGTILTRSVEVGQSVEPGGPALFRLAEGNEIELRGEVAEQDLPTLHVGQAATVRLTGFNGSFSGHVRLLGAVIDPQTRLGTVRIALMAEPNLRPGAFARAEVVVSDASRSVLPQTAVLSDEHGSYVLLVGPDNKIVRRPVQVSGIVANGVTISTGLEPDARVVATAGPFLQVGETVKPVLATAGS